MRHGGKEREVVHDVVGGRRGTAMVGARRGAPTCTTRNIHFYDKNLNDESKTVIEERFL